MGVLRHSSNRTCLWQKNVRGKSHGHIPLSGMRCVSTTVIVARFPENKCALRETNDVRRCPICGRGFSRNRKCRQWTELRLEMARRIICAVLVRHMATDPRYVVEASYLAFKHSQNNIKSCTVVGWAFKNCSCKRLTYLRWANPKLKYSLTHIRYCVRQAVWEGGNEIVNAQKAVAFRAGDYSIARRRALRLSRVERMEKENIPYRAVETNRLINVNVASRPRRWNMIG